jgi:RNA polymerase sigma factor (sigma-70 family)
MEDSESNDAALLERVRSGDIAAYAELYRCHVRVATRAALKWTRQPADAADLVSDCFTRTLVAIRAGKGPEHHFLPYLLSAVRNGAIEASRRAAKTIPVGTSDAVVDKGLSDPGPSADDAVFRNIDRSLVVKALLDLPERWRDVLVRTEIHGQSPKEIGQELGISPNSVSALAVRAREGLRMAWLAAHVTNLDEDASSACREVRPDLSAWLLGKVRSRRAKEIADHVGHCAQCSLILEELGTVRQNMRAFLLPISAGPPALALQSAHHRLPHRLSHRLSRRLLHRASLVAAGGGVAAAVILVAVLRHHGGANSPAPEAVPRATSASIPADPPRIAKPSAPVLRVTIALIVDENTPPSGVAFRVTARQAANVSTPGPITVTIDVPAGASYLGTQSPNVLCRKSAGGPIACQLPGLAAQQQESWTIFVAQPTGFRSVKVPVVAAANQ